MITLRPLGFPTFGVMTFIACGSCGKDFSVNIKEIRYIILENYNT
jgi:hypothetical protein